MRIIRSAALVLTFQLASIAASLNAQCPVATAASIGSACGTATLAASAPVLGGSETLTIDGTVGAVGGTIFQSPVGGAPFSFSGCEIHLNALNVAAVFQTDINGDATVAVSVPNDSALCGAELVFQAAVVSGIGPVTTLGVEVTNAMRLRVGAAPGTFPASWIHGSANCATNTDAAIQVHAYAPRTWILRQNACLNFEAPFVYLFAGDTKAILFDSGATSSASVFPLRATVQSLLDAYEAANGLADLELVVAHTHAHGDHAQGDGQFVGQPNTTVVGTNLGSVQSFFGITNWPSQIVSFDLGGRSLDIVPFPGHHSTHIAVYDGETGVLLSGDSLHPGYLYVPSLNAYKASIDRLVAFNATHPIVHILGAHIEMTATPGVAYSYPNVYQPNEHQLALEEHHLHEVDAALDSLFGFFSDVHDDFIITTF